jgi:hypothetical protein
MANLQTYEKGALFFGNVLLVEIQNFTVEHDAALSPVHTMQKGFAGVSPGSPMSKIEQASGIPRSGIEFDYLSKLQNVEIVEAVVYRGGKKLTAKGYITTVKEAFGTDKAAEISVSWIGKPFEESTA